MKQECSVWIAEENFDKVINKIKTHDEANPLYEGHSIEELYINSHDGSMEGFIIIGEIGVSVWIPFGDWFSNFIKFKAFDGLIKFLEEYQETVQTVVDKTHGAINLINSSVEKVKGDEDE